MPFADKETSRYGGEPIELYYFRYGSDADAFYAYTNTEEEVAYQGVIYQPIPIDRGKIATSGGLDKSSLRVTVPHEEKITELFVSYPPSSVVTLVIRNGHRGEDDFPVAWSGRVVNFAKKVNQAEFQCEPVSTSMRRSGLRRHYQYGCPHALYGPQCGASEVAATLTVAPVSVAGARITLANNWVPPVSAPNYLGGVASWQDRLGNLERRSILRIEDDVTLLLSGHASQLKAGDEVTLVLGCNRQMDNCRDLHNNIQNFGGCPWIPTKNPVKKNNFF